MCEGHKIRQCFQIKYGVGWAISKAQQQQVGPPFQGAMLLWQLSNAKVLPEKMLPPFMILYIPQVQPTACSGSQMAFACVTDS